MILNKNLQHMHIIRKVFLFPIRIKNKIFHFPLFRGCGNFFVIFQDGAQNPGRSSAKKLKLTSVTLIDLRIYHEFFQNFPTTLNVSHELFILGKMGHLPKWRQVGFVRRLSQDTLGSIESLHSGLHLIHRI